MGLRGLKGQNATSLRGQKVLCGGRQLWMVMVESSEITQTLKIDGLQAEGTNLTRRLNQQGQMEREEHW